MNSALGSRESFSFLCLCDTQKPCLLAALIRTSLKERVKQMAGDPTNPLDCFGQLEKVFPVAEE